MDEARLLSEMLTCVGEAHVLTGAEIAAYTTDPRNVIGPTPLVVVRPRTTDEVAAVVRACAAAGAAIVTQGGHTGMSGGAQVKTDSSSVVSVVLSLRRMTTIDAVDPTDGTATVEAGVTIEAIQSAAADVDLFFAPDWGARGSATIGGGIATNAGGNNVLHYGSMRDHVLGLEVVLADGRIWDGLRALHKDSSGYRLRDLFVGSEGTLGIITRAVVKLIPRLHDHRSAFVALRDLDAATALLTRVRDTGAVVAGFELIPERGVAGVVERFGRQRPLADVAEWYVLLRLGTPRGIDAGELTGDVLEGAFGAGLITDAAIAVTPEQDENLWSIRDEISPSLLIPDAKEGAKYDTAVPVGRVVEFVRRAAEIVEAIGGPEGWTPYAFGHVGDGNIHFYGLAPADPEPTTRAAIEQAVDALVVELGGTLSAEHGVGQMLVDRIGAQKPDIELELAWRLKRAFDPDQVLNPGKTLPPLEPGA